MKVMDIIDLHCDLLAYLVLSPDRTPRDLISRCSIPQLEAGRVQTQVLAISSETGIYSLLAGLEQFKIFLTLSEEYPGRFLPAIENASSFALENEPLDMVLKRLEKILAQILPLYISLTWNGENRFGGGCGAACGLKEDGKELLRFLSGKGIAVDFSHTSDHLASDLFNFIDQESLNIPVMASHSNFRAIVNNVRNLPDDIAKEIMRRRGIIGLVFYSSFLKAPEKLSKMVEHGLDLGGEKALALGADFFCLDDLTGLLHHGGGFFDEMADSSCYPQALDQLRKFTPLPETQLEGIASQNAFAFIEKFIPV